MILVRLTRVGGQEFAAPVDLVADRRNVMLVAAGAEEAEPVPGRPVPVEQPLDVAHQLGFGAKRRREVKRPVKANPLGDVRVELLDVLCADRSEHLGLHAWLGIRDVGVDGATLGHAAPRACDWQ